MHSRAGSAPFNMALDEAILEAMPRLRVAVLRFYGWTEPAASFGYFQKYSEVAALTLLRPMVRRPTGGGIVPHDSDWTYSMACPTSNEWYSLKAVESYRRVHEWIQAAFAEIGVSTELAPCCRESEPGQCFAGYEKSDVLWRGRKIAGAAQRRTRNGLLIQGSVQPPPGSPSRAEWENAFCKVAQNLHAVHWKSVEPDELLDERAKILVKEKYSLDRYNRKRE